MNPAVQPSEPFFRHFAWLILITVVICFGAKAVFDTADLPPITPLHHLHALSMLAWFALFAIQPTLIDRGHRHLHRSLGRWSPVLVVVMLALGVQISLLNWQRIGFPLIPAANLVNLLLFIGLYSAALIYRRAPATHKRLMLYATLAMTGPAFGRIPELFDAEPVMAVPLILAYQIAPVLHDFLVHRRVHPASWTGFGLMLAAVPVILGLAGSAEWAEFLTRVLGPPAGSP